MGFMTSLTTYCSVANIWSWCTYLPQGPCDVTCITFTDSTTRTRWSGELAVMPLTIFNSVIMPMV